MNPFWKGRLFFWLTAWFTVDASSETKACTWAPALDLSYYIYFFSLFVLSSVCIDIYAGESAGKEKKQKENAIMYDGD